MPGMDRYEIERELGRGAMGVVHLARDTELDRMVALKELTPTAAPNEERLKELLERFEREAKTAGALDNPNIVKIYETFSDEDRHFIVMEYLEGRTLDDVLKTGPLPYDATVGVTTQILGALKTAHDAGVVHRDLKPENIFVLADGLVKVADFGIARSEDNDKLTQAGQVLGTLGYMSPEQVRGQSVDGRADIFSLGVMLYEMLSGTNPFAADQPTTVMYKIAYEEPVAVDLIVSDLPAHIGAVIKKATAKDADLRYASAEEMLVDLEGTVAPDLAAIEASATARAVAQAAAPAPPVVKKPSRFSKKLLITAGIVAVLVLGSAAGGYAYYRDRQSKDAARQAAIRAEALAMVDRVAEIKGLRVELDKIVAALEKQADDNEQAIAKWDSELSRKQAAFEARRAEVSTHNAREEERRLASEVTEWDYWGWEYYSYYTYTPNLWDYPDYPDPPAKIIVRLTAQDAALIDLQKRLRDFQSALVTETASVEYFPVVYKRTREATDLLIDRTSSVRAMLTGVVVANMEKGDVINRSKLKLETPAEIDQAFNAVDQEVSLYIKNYGLSISELLATETSATPEATTTAK